MVDSTSILKRSKSARGRNSGVAQPFLDRVVVRVGVVLAQSLLQAELLLKGVVQPQARRSSAKQVVVARKDAPDLARIL